MGEIDSRHRFIAGLRRTQPVQPMEADAEGSGERKWWSFLVLVDAEAEDECKSDGLIWVFSKALKMVEILPPLGPESGELLLIDLGVGRRLIVMYARR